VRVAFSPHLTLGPQTEGSVDFPPLVTPLVSLMGTQHECSGLGLTVSFGVELAEQVASGRLCTGSHGVRAFLYIDAPSPTDTVSMFMIVRHYEPKHAACHFDGTHR
jgi:hypothetical protein